ncbi:hypothetical protein BKA70DRAFT_1405387 [Coprinopsis sp. MPI-PUGE-AT-0042]|nr:hypothetical protein BKA70DRAFT_1405387 [Coprinopsis sp. MPI-PUGE-AT-0042]
MAEIISSCHSPGIPHDPSTDNTLVGELVIYPKFLTSIQDLPDEVLAHIFWVALPSILDGPARQMLTALRLVCKRWNTVSAATPSLWRAVSIRVWDRPFGTSRYYTSDLEGTIGLWFQRGGDNAPCTLHLDHWSFRLFDKGSTARFLASPRRTWRELSFRIDDEFVSKLKDRLRENGGGGWNCLERLEISLMDTPFYDIPSVPSIKSLHLTDASHFALEGTLLEPPSTGNVLYRSLTSLHISRCIIPDPLAFARLISPTSFPSLRVLILDSLNYCHVRDPSDSRLEQPPLPLACKHKGVEHLTSIGSETAAVLVNLHLPSLKVWRLERITMIKWQMHSLEVTNEWYQRFAAHSTDNLHTLDLGESCMLPSQVAALLEKIPSVKQLYVQDFQFFPHLNNGPALVLAGIEEIVVTNPLPGTQVAERAGLSPIMRGHTQGSGIQAFGSNMLAIKVIEGCAGEGALPPDSHCYPQPYTNEAEEEEVVGSALPEGVDEASLITYMSTGVMPDHWPFGPFDTQNGPDNE